MRRRLLTWLLPSAFILSFVWLWGAYAIVIHFADVTYDRALEYTAETLGKQVQIHPDRFAVDLPPAAQRMLEFDRIDSVYYTIIDERHRIYAGNIALPGPRNGRPNGHGSTFYNGVIQGRPVRIVQSIVGDGGERRLSIRVAETRQERNILAREVLIYMIVPQLLLLASMILLIWIGVGRGVAPLSRVRDAITRLDPKNLRRIEEGPLPAELEEQVGVINNLIDRVAEMMAAQRRFITDAAHQLRTPVANIRVQVELALRANSHDDVRTMLGKIDVTSNRLVRLTGQLLALSRVEATDAVSGRFDTFPIEESLCDAVAGSVPTALLKGIDVAVEVPNGATPFYGDRHAIEQLVANLVDNAVLYTPHEGRILVKASADNDMIHIIVEDNGPGISEEHRALVLERFNRGSNPLQKGTGLGLSIVKEVVRLHRGRLALYSAESSGLRVEIMLLKDFRVAKLPNDERANN